MYLSIFTFVLEYVYNIHQFVHTHMEPVIFYILGPFFYPEHLPINPNSAASSSIMFTKLCCCNSTYPVHVLFWGVCIRVTGVPHIGEP